MNKVLIVVSSAGAVLLLNKYITSRTSNDGENESILDAAMTTIDEATSTITGTPLQDMNTSDQMLDILMRREKYVGTPYQLDDGKGMTWGYGHKGQGNEVPPSFISQPDAAALFADDVQNRAEKWVKMYVKVDLSQNEFDALTSIAFNMSPQSFKKFANEVNAGNGIAGIAEQSITWVKDVYKNGIRNRRTEEVSIFENGLYA